EFNEEIFDFEAEKNKLKEKIDSFKTKITGKKLREFNLELTILNTLNQGDSATKTAILNLWKKLGETEVDVYKKEMEPAPTVPEAQEKTVEIPSQVLVDIVKNKPAEMKAVVERAFGSMLGGTSPEEGIADALKTLFASRPDDTTMKELRKFGIKDWNSFKKMWDEKLSQKVAGVLRKWSEEQLRAHIILNAGGWESFVTETKKFGAIKGDLAKRVLMTAACVGGGAVLASFLWPAGIAVAGVAIGGATAGGAAGGLIRGLLNRLAFGGKEKKQEQAGKMQEAKTRRIEELVAKKRDSLAKELVAGMFSGDTAKADSEALNFSAFLAEAVREGQKEEGKFKIIDKNRQEQEVVLSGNAQRMYEDALKHLKQEGGLELDATQKIELALAISKLQISGDQKVAEKVKSSDPLVVRALDGFFKAYSGRLGEEEGKLATVGGVGASTVMGAAIGTAFFSFSGATRAAMGAAGFGLAGYRVGEFSVKKEREKEAVKEIEIHIEKIRADNLNYKQSLSQNSIASQQDRDIALKLLKSAVDKLKVAKKGKGNMAWAAAINNQPMLRAKADNIISELTREGIYGEREVFATWDKALNKIREEGNHLDEIAEVARGRKATGKEKAKIALYSLAGAAVGAAFSFGLGYGAQELREHFGFVREAQGATRPHEASSQVEQKAGVASEKPVASAPVAELAPPPETHSAYEIKSVISEKIVSRGGSAESSVKALLRDAGKNPLFQNENGKPWTATEKSAWMRQELNRLQIQDTKSGELSEVGYQYGHGAVKHPLMLYRDRGAKFEIFEGTDGKAHLRLIGEEGKDFKVLDNYLVEKARGKIKLPGLDEAQAHWQRGGAGETS
ncbi:MAG: hypothetical protein ABII98_01970, partial [bacterium]